MDAAIGSYHLTDSLGDRLVDLSANHLEYDPVTIGNERNPFVWTATADLILCGIRS